MTDFTTTPNLGLYKPVVDADENFWGDHINFNADKLDQFFGSSAGGPFLPLAGGIMRGPVSWISTGTSGAYDAQITATGGGTQPGHGEFQVTAALTHFYTFDDSEQFRVGSVPGASERWEARGGITGAGATMVASGTATNVDGIFVAQGNGAIHFRNFTSPLFEVFPAAGGPTVNYLQIVAGKTGDFIGMVFTGSDPDVSAYISTKGAGQFYFVNGSNTNLILRDPGAPGTNPLIFYPGTATINAWLTSANGSVSVGGAVIPTTATEGFLLIPRMDGTPTGVPAVTTRGVPIVYNDTGNRLHIFSGGVWRSVALT